MAIIEKNIYKNVDISGHETAVKNKIKTYVESIEGETDDEKRVNLPLIKKHKLHDTIDYIMNDLPDGVSRVDGKSIRPILIKVIDEKISELPVQKEKSI